MDLVTLGILLSAPMATALSPLQLQGRLASWALINDRSTDRQVTAITFFHLITGARISDKSFNYILTLSQLTLYEDGTHIHLYLHVCICLFSN